MHQHMNDGRAWFHIVICTSIKTGSSPTVFVRVKTGSSPNCYFEHFVRKDSEEDIETNIFI